MQDYYVGLDLLSQEYRVALRALLSECRPTDVYLRRVEELKAEHRKQRALEMAAVREQWESDDLLA